jgi:hypothetical protein
MTSGMKNEIKIFEQQEIRRVWSEEFGEWFFSVVDIIAALTDQPDKLTARKYWNKLKQRLLEEGNETVTNCHQLKMLATDGKMRLTDVATTRQLFRIVQSIPSKKAEPLKLWLAEVGNERINEAQDPEIAIERAINQYRNLGFDEEWIKLRIQSIEVRKELTNEWRKSGVKSSQDFAILTDLMTREWSGKSIKEYKQHKNLKKESLRDNMTNIEIILNMLAEASTKEIHQTKDIVGSNETKTTAIKGASVAKRARLDLEQQTGRSAISSQNAKNLRLGKGDE